MKLLTKAGRPTAYGLACGYVERYRIGNFSGVLQRYPATNVYLVTEDERIAYRGTSVMAARRAFDNGKRIAERVNLA